MDIKDRIKKIGSYFQNMQVENVNNEQIVYVVVKFPPKWFIDEGVEKFNVSVGDSNGSYYFCASIEDGFDAVFDAIEYNIDKMVTAQERAMLLKQKINDLQELFSDESISIESLRTLDFAYKGKKKKNAKQEENKEENIEGNAE